MNNLSFKNSWIEWLLVAGLIVLSPIFLFPKVSWLWSLLAVPLLLFIRYAIRKEVLPRTHFNLPLILLLLVVLVSMLSVPDILFSLPKAMGVLFGILVFYALIALVKRIRSIDLALIGFVASGAVFSAIGLMGIKWDYDSLLFALARVVGIKLDQTIFYRDVIPFLDGLIPRFIPQLPGAELGFNGNAIGGTLTLIFPITAVLFFLAIRRKNIYTSRKFARLYEWIAVISFLLMSFVLFLTFSVTSWIALSVSFWLIFLPPKWKALTVGMLILTVASVLVIFPGETASTVQTVSKGLDPDKIEYRLKWWDVGVKTISENPVVGVGLNRMRLHPEVGYEESHVHNQYLQTAAELGLIGLAAYLALIGVAVFTYFRALKAAGTVLEKSWIKGIGCGLLAFCLFGMVDAIPLGTKVGLFFWISLALLTVQYFQVTGKFKRGTG